jgi:hypothetical protein
MTQLLSPEANIGRLNPSNPSKISKPFANGLRLPDLKLTSTALSDVSVQFGADAPKTPAKPKKQWGLFKTIKAMMIAGVGVTTLGLGSYMTSYTSINYNAKKMSYFSNASFKFYGKDGFGNFKEQWINFNLTRVKSQIAFRINEVLQNRPDLREVIDKLPGGIEIRLYETDSLESKDGGHVVGLAQIEKNKGVGSMFGGAPVTVSMSFATKFVDNNLELSSVGNDVIAHELTHILDFIEKRGEQFQLVGGDGLLPGMSDSQQLRFIKARNEELPKIQAGFSPMDKYALENEKEFLAVLAETFFEKPRELKASNPELYNYMSNFFELDPAASFPMAAVKGLFLRGDLTVDYMEKRQPEGKYYIWGGYGIIIAAGGMWVLGRKVKGKKSPEEEIDDLSKQYMKKEITYDAYIKRLEELQDQIEARDKKKIKK